MKEIAIVTGGSRGIGAATVRRLAENGYAVCVNYRQNEESAEQLVAEILDRGGSACAVRADIAQEAQVVALFDECERSLGVPNALINNAGILMPQMPLLEMTAERVLKVLATNVVGALVCCRESVKRMSTSRGGSGGSIVNVSSIAARTGSPGEYIDYAASKGALDTLTIGLAKEVAQQGIRVNAVRPGFIYTDMHASGGEPDRIERVKQGVPMQRGGQASEVAAAIAWLVSDESSYSTGTFIDVAGGRS